MVATDKTREIFDNDPVADLGGASGVSALRITSNAAHAFNEAAFLGRLGAAAWRGTVKFVDVSFDSNLTDCSFMRQLPALESAVLAGKSMRSTRGISAAGTLAKLKLRTSKANRIALDELAESTITSLHIERPRKLDLEAIRSA